MAFNHTLSAILRGQWLLDHRWANAHIPLVISMLKGNPVSFVDRTGSQEMERPFAINPVDMQRHELYVYDPVSGRILPNPNIPANSVGILPITGPVTKYNGECGEAGSIQKNTWLMDMGRRQNIGSIVLLLDTPGGEARAASTLTTTIERFKKPILSYVDGCTASLGVWYSSASDEVYLADESSSMGSVGSYISFLDFSGLLEKEGIKLHEIYAPQSTDKNKDYHDAMQGDYTLIKEDLKRGVDLFINSVKKNRPETVATEAEWNTGKMFTGKDAVKVGLADGIFSLDRVVTRAAWLANQHKS